MTNALASYLTNRATGAVWNSIPSDVRVGVAGSLLGGLIGSFVLPWYIPSTVPMAGGAGLGVLANRTVRHIQQEGSASLWQRFRNIIANAGSYLVRAMESLYHYFTNRGNQPVNYARLDTIEPAHPAFSEDDEDAPAPLLTIPPLEQNYFSKLEEEWAKKNLQPAATETQREASKDANLKLWMGNPEEYTKVIEDDIFGRSEELAYRSNEPKSITRVLEEYDDVFETTVYTHQVQDPLTQKWTTTHIS